MWARRPALQAALLRLSDPFREALFLSDGAGLVGQELADALDCSPIVARHRVLRGRAALMELLGEKKRRTHEDYGPVRTANRQKARSVKGQKRVTVKAPLAAVTHTTSSYVNQLNLRLFERLLAQTSDPNKRRALEARIQQEIDKQHPFGSDRPRLDGK